MDIRRFGERQFLLRDHACMEFGASHLAHGYHVLGVKGRVGSRKACRQRERGQTDLEANCDVCEPPSITQYSSLRQDPQPNDTYDCPCAKLLRLFARLGRSARSRPLHHVQTQTPKLPASHHFVSSSRSSATPVFIFHSTQPHLEAKISGIIALWIEVVCPPTTPARPALLRLKPRSLLIVANQAPR